MVYLFESKPSMWYKEIKRICGKSPSGVDFCSDSNDEKVANQLNGHLARIIQSLPPFDVNKTIQEYQKIPHDDIPLPTISEGQVFSQIKKLKRTSITPIDIPIELIKAFPDKLTKPLMQIFNYILTSSVYPQIWKTGYVTPIPKKDTELNFDGVRPINVPPLFSKMYESFVANWLKAEVEPLLDPHQYGNRKNTSTSHYLVSLLHFILKHVDEPGKWLNLITIDFKKGFDLIDHNILISKLLIDFRVNPVVVKIIQSFLINRFQIFKYKKSFSEPEPVFCGVPQGTILGPILFLVMINNIANDCEVRWKYVDDLTLGEICEANECSKAQILIDNVKTKASVSNMTVNDSKSSILTISFLNSSEPNFLPTISDSLKVSKIKLLGVIITSDLNGKQTQLV